MYVHVIVNQQRSGQNGVDEPGKLRHDGLVSLFRNMLE